MTLQLVIDNTSSRRPEPAPLADLAYIDSVIERTRSQLLDDLGYYQKKIADIGELDPQDRTGLMSLYRAHEHHIRCLLGMITDASCDE